MTQYERVGLPCPCAPGRVPRRYRTAPTSRSDRSPSVAPHGRSHDPSTRSGPGPRRPTGRRPRGCAWTDSHTHATRTINESADQAAMRFSDRAWPMRSPHLEIDRYRHRTHHGAIALRGLEAPLCTAFTAARSRSREPLPTSTEVGTPSAPTSTCTDGARCAWRPADTPARAGDTDVARQGDRRERPGPWLRRLGAHIFRWRPALAFLPPAGVHRWLWGPGSSIPLAPSPVDSGSGSAWTGAALPGRGEGGRHYRPSATACPRS